MSFTRGILKNVCEVDNLPKLGYLFIDFFLTDEIHLGRLKSTRINLNKPLTARSTLAIDSELTMDRQRWLDLAGFAAVGCSAYFSGAAWYINLVHVPTLFKTVHDTKTLLNEWRLCYSLSRKYQVCYDGNTHRHQPSSILSHTIGLWPGTFYGFSV